jgi:hypothetical protein
VITLSACNDIAVVERVADVLEKVGLADLDILVTLS